MLRPLVPLLAIGCAMLSATGTLHGQTPQPPATATVVPAAQVAHPDSVAAMLPFARAFVALNALRERADAAYAEPKNKKPEELAGLREKFRLERDALLKTHGFTDATYARITQRVSGDEAARLAFEAALAKATAK